MTQDKEHIAGVANALADHAEERATHYRSIHYRLREHKGQVPSGTLTDLTTYELAALWNGLDLYVKNKTRNLKRRKNPVKPFRKCELDDLKKRIYRVMHQQRSDIDDWEREYKRLDRERDLYSRGIVMLRNELAPDFVEAWSDYADPIVAVGDSVLVVNKLVDGDGEVQVATVAEIFTTEPPGAVTPGAKGRGYPSAAVATDAHGTVLLQIPRDATVMIIAPPTCMSCDVVLTEVIAIEHGRCGDCYKLQQSKAAR